MIMAILFAHVAARGENILAAGDVLEIEAVGLRDFRQDMIDLNGQASFLLIGDIKAPGKLTVCLDIRRDSDIGSIANHLAFVWSSYASTVLKVSSEAAAGHCAWIDADARLTSSDTKSPSAAALWAGRTRD
ncbi:hypothetical protein [Bradyrhizobium sp. RDI18]|uniref:hypothetical protein n=1 Tax=Bradyrhizobium sp. RDI18 TaxID=3367400 RepID=UPI0037219638